jgi:hypothetical protein
MKRSHKSPQRQIPRRWSTARRSRLGSQCERLEDRVLLTAVTFNAPSSSGGDGTYSVQSREGQTVYVAPAYLYYNLNPQAAFPGFVQGDDLYLKVEYFDEGSGTIFVQYDSTRENFDRTDAHSRSTRVNSQQFVASYHYLDSAQFANGANGNDFRVAAWGAAIGRVTVSSEPFEGSGIDWAWAPPWESPYTGPSRPVDASTLAGKVLAGYQGWFNTPNDAADEGYVHWGVPGDWSIEQWPDPNDYDPSELFAVPGVTTARGAQAYLFSSANASVVDRHFEWMREHDIDGVLLQRFRGSFMKKDASGAYTGEPQWPVVNARDAAHRSGRTWAIEYDIQNGGSPAERDQVIQQVKDDWEFLTDPAGMDMLSDSHYQRENGKPVVAIFGLYVGATNAYSTAQQQDLINYFQTRGVYVVGAGRHTESGAQIANAALHDAYIPWQGYWKGGNSYSSDEIRLNGVTTHVPHVFPGFSWTHLQNSSTATSRDREDGDFYWRMLSDAANETDAPWWFIGMFDEYDEATNLIPATDDPPVPDTDAQGNPLTYQVSDPRPNDWWLALTGAAKQALLQKTSINDTSPSEADLQNRSNVGGEVSWAVGGEDRLRSVSTADGAVEVVNVPVQGGVSSAIRSSDPYLYFCVDDGFLFGAADGRDVTIEVEYLDVSVGQFGLQYDGVASSYSASPAAVLTDSGQWRTHRFQISDAFFGNRQTDGADFRLTTPSADLLIRRVSVLKESVLSVEVDLGQLNTNSGLRQVAQSGDGQTVVVTDGGRQARMLTGDPTSLYLYLDIDSGFADAVDAGLNAIVEVVYQDVGAGQLNIQYDATGPAYKNANAVAMTASGAWRTARFYLDDAYFGGRQNGASDLRVVGAGIPIDRVRVLHSFGDLIAPTLQANTVAVDSPTNSVVVTWSVMDDWRTGQSDRWAAQEDNRVGIQWSDDGGLSWQTGPTVYQAEGASSSVSYDVATGAHIWSQESVISTNGMPTGVYLLRLTPIDGRGNAGDSVVTAPIAIYASPSLPGDYNLDGVVDAGDYTLWRDLIGIPVTPYTAADGDGSGLIDAADHVVWRNHYGATSTNVATAALIAAEIGVTPSSTFSVEPVDHPSAPLTRAFAPVTDDSLAIDAAFAALMQPSPRSSIAVASVSPLQNQPESVTRDLLLLYTDQSRLAAGDEGSENPASAVQHPSEPDRLVGLSTALTDRVASLRSSWDSW